MPGLKFTYLSKQTIYSKNKHKKIIYLTEWFHEQAEFTVAFECMSTEKMNNEMLSKFYVPARKDGNYYKKQTLINLK